MKKVELTQGQYALVDDEDYPIISATKWYALFTPRTKKYYARRNTSLGNKKRGFSLMHQFILGVKGSIIVDHINGDTLDNRKVNLRIVNYSQNVQNSRIRKDNKSGYRGVSFYKKNKKWGAKIGYNNKYFFLGLFPTAEKASEAYKKSEKKYFRNFARKTEYV